MEIAKLLDEGGINFINTDWCTLKAYRCPEGIAILDELYTRLRYQF